MRARFDGASCNAWMNARTRLSGSFTGSMRPTVPTSQSSRVTERAALDGFSTGLGRPESRGIDAVVELGHPFARHAHLRAEVALEILRQGDVLGDERPIQPARPLVFSPRSIEIADVASVLTVDADGNARGECRHHRFERGKVAAVHDGRAQFAEQRIQPWIELDAMTRLLVERDELHIVAHDAPMEIRDLGERDHRVP